MIGVVSLIYIAARFVYFKTEKNMQLFYISDGSTKIIYSSFITLISV